MTATPDLTRPSRVRRLADPATRFERATAATAKLADLDAQWGDVRRQAVAELRDSGMSVRKIAERLGLSPTQVQRLLRQAPWTRDDAEVEARG